MSTNEFLATPQVREKIADVRYKIRQREKLGVAVIGAGKSGLAAARLLESLAIEHQIFDDKPIYESLSLDALRKFDLVVLSPGVPRTHEALEDAVQRGIVVGEIEFASWFIDIPMVGITGTNGKSTTTALLGHILEQGGVKAFVGGNFGQPLSELALSSDDFDIAVVELSSFQLESLVLAKFSLGCWLNLSADHTDRYADLEAYARAKACLLHHCYDAPIVLNADDSYCRAHVERYCADRDAKHWFTTEQKTKLHGESMTCAKDSEATFTNSSGNRTFSLTNQRLPGIHNHANMIAAIACAMALDVDVDAIQKGVASFEGLEHRIELVAAYNGVHWYNDSKATNVESALTGVRAMKGRTVLIAGGVDKGGSWKPLTDEQERLKHILAIGAATNIILEAFRTSSIICEPCENLQNAVTRAFQLTGDGENVLLSPACSSFDQFDNYIHRGNVFRELVNKQLGEKVG
ncbi:MAG: UDP-N-acetylmuramoyl-L-alanine--D-glutamate ligase [Myxococcota bacterium]|nr:UDP-N-acetylmuramoyl-L-alanine--D-glutamate ligase [Myxococcota bacterium]